MTDQELQQTLASMKERLRRASDTATEYGMNKTPESSAFDRGYLFAIVEMEQHIKLRDGSGPMYSA